jgi:adenosylmethionine-8-amino-7-oxononanoate aminotransferase
MTAGKGCSSGYWPLGLTIASGAVAEAVAEGGFIHGFTYSHHLMGAAVGRAVFARLQADDLVKASRVKGERLLLMLREAIGGRNTVGNIRGRGMMIGAELVRNKATKAPFDRGDRMAERVVAAAKERGLLLYSSTGCADGVNGDILMFGPPFTISDSEMAQLVEITAEAVGTI